MRKFTYDGSLFVDTLYIYDAINDEFEADKKNIKLLIQQIKKTGDTYCNGRLLVYGDYNCDGEGCSQPCPLCVNADSYCRDYLREILR